MERSIDENKFGKSQIFKKLKKPLVALQAKLNIPTIPNKLDH
jgi:hypothetical protein